MKSVISICVFLVMVISLLLSGCSSTTTSSTTTTTSPPSSTATVPPSSTSSTSATSSVSSTTSASTTASADWWDKFGTPQYGGEINYGVQSVLDNVDPLGNSYYGLFSFYLDYNFVHNATTNPNDWGFKLIFAPDEYWTGNLIKSWDMPNPTTFIAHLQQGVHWQNKPPVNGREFVADDVVQHYDRILGDGSGYTTPIPFWVRQNPLLQSVTAVDKYTVQFNLKKASAMTLQYLVNAVGGNQIEAPEQVKMPGGMTDWHNAVADGPWILSDYASGSQLTLTKNPDYWGHDQRYPQNKVPYVDQLNLIIIPDSATRLAALRTGKVDITDNLGLVDAQSLTKTSPNILQAAIPQGGQTADLVVNKKPFSDIRVRTAMSMAINRPEIAQSHYGGTVDGTPSGMSNPVTAAAGWGYAYSQWPQSLKDQYTYNPTQAKALLAQAGYPNGFTTTMQAPVTADTELMQIFLSEWKDIGITVNPTMLNVSAYTGAALGHHIDNIGWNVRGKMGGQAAPSQIINWYHTGDPSNYQMVDDPTYEGYWEAFQNATTEAQAKQAFAQADQLVVQQHWSIGAFPVYNYVAYQPYLKGYNGELTAAAGGGSFNRVWAWADMWISK